MNDPVEVPPPEPQLGLRRRRRAIPDQQQQQAAGPPPLPNRPPPPADDDDDDDDDDVGNNNNNNNNRRPRWNNNDRRHRRNTPLDAATGNNTTTTTTTTRRDGDRIIMDHDSSINRCIRLFRVSHLYCIVSTILAVLAIVVVTLPPSSSTQNSNVNTTTNINNQHNNNNNNNNNNILPTHHHTIPPPSSSSSSQQWAATAEQVVKAAAVGVAARRGEINTPEETHDLLQSMQQWWNMRSSTMMQYHHNTLSTTTNTATTTTTTTTTDRQEQQRKQQNDEPIESKHNHNHHHHIGGWLKWITKQFPTDNHASNSGIGTSSTGTSSRSSPPSPAAHIRLIQFIDPAILNPTPHTPTDIIEKVLTSTPRLLAIANFLLAMTYLLHSAVAAWFLGQHNSNNNGNDDRSNNNNMNNQQNNNNNNNLVVDWSTSAGARERMGGFLVFKLLLISAVVAPDTLDLLILLTWYTMLSCLRSLDHLAHATTTHLSALGQPPRSGVLKLEFLVLACNVLAAATCVALFHAAGWGMVLLLTCDCALLAADVLSHILKHVQCVLDDQHSEAIRALEERQLDLHNNRRSMAVSTNQDGDTAEMERTTEVVGRDDDDDDEDDNRYQAEANDNNNYDDDYNEDDHDDEAVVHTMSAYDIQQESRRLDENMERFELAHARRLSILDNIMFGLELVCHVLTVAHFCHIWSLHGVQFTLIDGVLALHLHSAVSSACKKIAQRRNIHSIARDLQDLFPNASDEELRKASLAGDVCCICLGSMSTGGHVKKVRCGHLYHTHCLREVVERAQSIQAARCPLCRASVLDGRRPADDENEVQRTQPANMAQPNAGIQAGPAQQPMQQQGGGGERALFRFSTEGIFPAWIPIPAFSFEVVRRPPQPPPAPAQPPVATPRRPPQPQQEANATTNTEAVAQNETTDNNDNTPETERRRGIGNVDPTETDNINNDNNNQIVDQGPEAQQPASFLRRLLVLAGAIPMSPEEEARALAQLVDMFPQYDRSDLLRELRERGSAESVAEAILMGIFSGVPRGD